VKSTLDCHDILFHFGGVSTVHTGDRKAGSGKQALADHIDLEEEMGDVLFTVLELCNKLSLDASVLLEKTGKRYEEKLRKLKAA